MHAYMCVNEEYMLVCVCIEVDVWMCVSNACAYTYIAVFLYAYTWEGHSLTSCIFLYHLSTIVFEYQILV